jgi:hypothetical protein
VAVRVVDQDVGDVLDDGRRRLRVDRRRDDAEIERASVGGQPAVPGGPQPVDDRDEVDLAAFPRHVTRHREQRVDRALEPVDLLERSLDVDPLEVQGLELEAQRGERGPELMRGVGREGALALEQLLEAFGGAVEGGGDRVELRDARARRARAEVAVAQPGRRVGEPVDRPDQAPRDSEGRQGGRDHDPEGDGRDDEQPLAYVGIDPRRAARRSQRGGDPLAGENRDSDDEPARALLGGGLSRAQRRSHWVVRGDRPGPGEQPTIPCVHREPVARARHLDRVTRSTRDVDRAGGGNRVALEADQLLVPELALLHDAQRNREQHHAGGRHRHDGDHEPSPHSRSSR